MLHIDHLTEVVIMDIKIRDMNQAYWNIRPYLLATKQLREHYIICVTCHRNIMQSKLLSISYNQ